MESLPSGSVMEVSGSQQPVPPTKRGWRFYGTFATLAVINLICAIDATILAVALPTIAEDLKATAIQAFWVGTSFLLCSTVFQPSWASFSHIIGRKSVILAALFIFTVGTIICSVATDVTVLLVGRCIQGIGGGGLTSLSYVIVSDMVSLRERPNWWNIINAMWAIGTLIGPIFGGLFAQRSTWRWAFWINIPFCVIAAIGIPICIRLHIKEGSVWVRMQEFDWTGSFIFTASLTSFLIPITWGGVMYDWSSWRTLVPLLLGVAGLIGFILHSAYISSMPLIRPSLFTSTTTGTWFGTFIQGLIVWALLYYMPIYFQVAKNYGAFGSSIAIIPFTLTISPASIATGVVIKKTGRYRISLWFGWFLTVLGSGLLIHFQTNTAKVAWVFMSLVSGLGLGILFTAQSYTAQAAVCNADIPFAGAMYSFFRALGQTIGVAISGVIFQNTFKKKILATAYEANAKLWAQDSAALVQVVKRWSNVGAEGEMKSVVVEVYVQSLQMVWIVMTALAALAFMISIFWTAEHSMDRELETEQGFRYDGEDKKVRKVVDVEAAEGSSETSHSVKGQS